MCAQIGQNKDDYYYWNSAYSLSDRNIHMYEL